MILAIILVGVCQIMAIFCVGFLLRRYVENKQREYAEKIETAIRDLVEPGPDGKPSKLADMLAMMGAVVGSSAARSLRAALQQQQSAVAQVANGAADELQGMDNPLVGLLTGGRRGKNAAVQRLGAMLMQMFGRSVAGAGNGQNELQGSLLSRMQRGD